jgi:serine/threonine-protein kinase
MEEVGRFKLQRELSSSPYATTYEAQDGAQRCAVKVLSDEALPEDPALRAGLAEALAGLKAIEHPSVVRVVDSGEADGNLFVATEFLDAPTLEQLLAEGPLDEQQVVLFVRQLAQALDKARDAGYCHGDLTSANVFVVSPEKVKISNFSVRALLASPPDVSALEEAGGGLEADEDDWVTAEDLLRSRTTQAVAGSTQGDLAALAGLTMEMLGADAAPRDEGEDLNSYRERLLASVESDLAGADSPCGVHTVEVIRRMLTEDGFDSPGEVVVELASAMLLGRTLGRARTQAAGPAAPGAETAQVAEAPAVTAVPAGPTSSADLDGLEFRGDPREAPFTPFFIWTDRRGGRFLVLHDGERLSLGRDPDLADVTLMDPAISRRHCYLVKEGGTITVEDAGSSNGTFVNDERIDKIEVSPTDAIRVGTTRIYMTVVAREG